MPLAHRLRRRVQFYETDAAGIVHFSTYFRYFEEAEHALWRAAGLSIAPPDAEVGWPRVAARFDYHAPLQFEQEFDVEVEITDLARRTIRYACRITRDGTPIATGSFVIVCVRRTETGGMAAAEIPDRIARALRGEATPEPEA